MDNPNTALPLVYGLLPRLGEILDGIADPQFAGKLRRVFQEASKAINGLGELPLGKYETMVESGSPDLSMWEELAPVIRDTVMDVNALLSCVREVFPAEVSGGLADMFGKAIEEAHGPEEETALLLRRMDEVQHQIHVLSSVLASEVTNLGERIRSPQVVSDRWNLMSDLQEFRGKFRNAIGEMLFVSATQFRFVTRGDVIPGYAEEVTGAVELRRGVTDLARLLQAYLNKLKTATADAEARPVIEGLATALDAFGRSKSYWSIRAQDKRRIIEFRHHLNRLSEGAPSRETVQAVLADFANFVQGLTHINRRDSLIDHDREIMAACAVMIEDAEGKIADRPGHAAEALVGAVKLAGALYGRDPSLDGYLRKSRKRDWSTLKPDEIMPEIDTFRGLIVGAVSR